MEQKLDGTEVLETSVEVATETTQETQGETLTTEQIAELRAKAAEVDDLKEKNKQLFERTKKAESRTAPSKEGELTTKDVLFLAKENLHEEDQEMLLKYAKANQMTLTDARKELKDVFSVKEQQRKSAAAINTGSARGTSKVSGEELLARAKLTGEVPDDEEGMAEIFKARLARKVSRYQKR